MIEPEGGMFVVITDSMIAQYMHLTGKQLPTAAGGQGGDGRSASGGEKKGGVLGLLHEQLLFSRLQ
jgi:hypothetical protein